MRFVSKLITALHNARAYERIELCVRSEWNKVWLLLYQAILLLLMRPVIRYFPIPVERLLKSPYPSVCPHETTPELLNLFPLYIIPRNSAKYITIL